MPDHVFPPVAPPRRTGRIVAAAVLVAVVATYAATEALKPDLWSGHVIADTQSHTPLQFNIPIRHTLEDCRNAAEYMITDGQRWTPELFRNPVYECGLNCKPHRLPDGTVQPYALMVCEETHAG